MRAWRVHRHHAVTTASPPTPIGDRVSRRLPTGDPGPRSDRSIGRRTDRRLVGAGAGARVRSRIWPGGAMSAGVRQEGDTPHGARADELVAPRLRLCLFGGFELRNRGRLV